MAALTPGEALAQIHRQNEKLPQVDHNGRPIVDPPITEASDPPVEPMGRAPAGNPAAGSSASGDSWTTSDGMPVPPPDAVRQHPEVQRLRRMLAAHEHRVCEAAARRHETQLAVNAMIQHRNAGGTRR